MSLSIEEKSAETPALALGGDDANSQARLFKTLADPARLRILRLLAPGEMGFTRIMEKMEESGIAQSGISHHLLVLKRAGLLTQRRQGLNTYYALRRAPLASVREYIAGLLETTEVRG